MANVPLRVHQDIILTDQMFIEPKEAVLLLPAKTRYEQDDGGTETTTERRVIFSPEIPRRVGEARAEWKILLDVAAATYPDRAGGLGCETGDILRGEIARVIPSYAAITHLLKSGDQFQYGGPHLCADYKFPTPDGKAHFRPVQLPTTAREPGTFRLATRRGKQFNTLIYAETDPLTGAPRDAVLMSPDDAADLHLKQADGVTLVNEQGRYAARVFIAPLARGTLQAHWPEANVLIKTGPRDPGGKVPDYNATVRVEVAGTAKPQAAGSGVGA
jgi:predicted molibdopterin-dependent oxidoreductase YjgC